MTTRLIFREPELPIINSVPINLVLVVMAMAGTYGAVWVSDDFDAWRLGMFAFLGVPLAGLYILLECFHPKWRRRFYRYWISSILVLSFVFCTGLLPLINAMTAEDQILKRTFADAPFASMRDYKRGGFGQLFRVRW